MPRLRSDRAYDHDPDEINTPTRRRQRLASDDASDEDERKRVQRQDQDVNEV